MEPTPPVSLCSMKLKQFFGVHWRGIVCVTVPIIFLPLVFPPPTKNYSWVAYTLCNMAVLWVCEAIPLPVTALLPLVIFPLTNVMPGEVTCKLYINDTVYVFLGSLMLAASIEQSGLHNRLALCTIRSIGYSHYKLLFAMSCVTMFVSMWLTNTAATTMMVPINFALLKVFEDQGLLKIFDTTVDGDLIASKFTVVYFCSATYSATIGGIGTLVGTGTNLVFKGLMETTYPDAPEYLSFPLFSAFTLPYMLMMETCLYLSMIIIFFGFLRPKSDAAKRATLPPEGIVAAKQAVEQQAAEIGNMTCWEIMSLILFTLSIVLFFTRSPQMFSGWGDRVIDFFGEKNKKFIRDSVVATFVCFLMLWLPQNCGFLKYFTAKTRAELPHGRIRSVLDWPTMNAVMPWSFMFLLGGGFAISGAAGEKYSDLNGIIGSFLSKLAFLPNEILVLVVIVFTVFLTNFASNIAVANVIVPIGMSMAGQIGANPLLYNLASGIAASYCFMLPVGTPGNLVVQSAAKIATKQMIVAGSAVTVTTILLSWAVMILWAPVIWPDLKKDTKTLSWISKVNTEKKP